ncbi:hypothetical protein QVD17_09082 [Tagetes erecta]|uniref:FAF domain-containing protein n=1 Tax=Tagetes erecta TaxID=13708 RepID=A0AAD8L0X1_TARER|nr:hypothetical protein QVD17_09082 [Tagetes erecta]
MSTILCPQSSLDPSHVVIEATTMTLKLSYNQASFYDDLSQLQSPSHKPFDHYFHKETNPYLHNQKSLKLSQESLELCTESLGSETGSDMSDNDTIFSAPSSSLFVTKSRRVQTRSKKELSRSFPPPLMTISGPKMFQVTSRRVGGRLVMEAIETELGKDCLRVERSHGRLRLTCWKDEKEDLEMGSNENDMKETFQKLRRCNEEENGDKGISCNWEPCCWVATS